MDKYDYITATIEEEKIRLEKLIAYLKEKDLFVTWNGFADTEQGKKIHMTRFFHTQANRPPKKEIKAAEKLESASLAAAFDFLKSAGMHHFRLESIYQKAMDFEALRKACEAWKEEVLKILSDH